MELIAKGDRLSNSLYKNWFFERQPTAAFQKTNFGSCSAVGAATPKIGFIMRITDRLNSLSKNKIGDRFVD